MNEKYNFAFKDLKVWHKAMKFADNILLETENINTDRKHYRLIEQLESAVTSIAQNIAEGKGRFSKKEYIKFLFIARGSLYETITILNIFAKRGWLTSEKLNEFEREGFEITNMLKGLINSVKKSLIKSYIILCAAMMVLCSLAFTFHH